MLTPILNVLSTLLDQGIAMVPIILGLACLLYGGYLALGSHEKGRQGLIFAFIGGAVMLGSKTIAAGIHP